MTPPAADVLTVGQINRLIRQTLLDAFPEIWVAGEIADLSRPRSGHLYFSLKDDSGQINVVLWRSTAARLPFEPEDGVQVLCRGEIDVYSPRGTYQLIAREMQLQGEGALQAALRKLQQKLASEGLFDAARKRPLPRFPAHIAVVTSPSGAALKDFLEVVRRRWRGVRVTILPTRVQGKQAAEEIAATIQVANRLRPQPDVLLVTRGGGSLEDLWGFNDERVVRAIYNAPIPVISAVGHEIDVTLSDLVADVRALTPSEAGERVVPDGREIQAYMRQQHQRMSALMAARIDNLRLRIDSFAHHRLLRDPRTLLREHARTIDELQQRAHRAMMRSSETLRAQLAEASGRIQALSPLNVLARGYSLTTNSRGKIVTRVSEVKDGDEVHVRLADGTLTSRVTSVQADDDGQLRRGEGSR